MTNIPFVPDDFEVPDGLETDHFRLRMLSVDDCEKDYAAVMETQAHFHGLGFSWPREGFTLAENLADLERHQKEFLAREAFAYTVVAPDESRVLGCMYIDPHEAGGAEIWMWVRTSEYERLDHVLFETVRDWVTAEWPFEKVRYPGREAG